MRWFMDSEFAEDGKTIELISIALVSEDGAHSYYAVSQDFDYAKCNEWVRANVLPKLPDRMLWTSRSRIADDLREMLLANGGKPEIWGYFSDYDWVVFCQLFGRMIDLPKGMPFWCRDLKQHMETFGVKKAELPAQAEGSEHDALADAEWVRKGFLAVETMRKAGGWVGGAP